MNGICKIDLDGKEIRFLFGMPAIRIFTEKYMTEYVRQSSKIEGELDPKELDNLVREKIGDFKTASYIVFGGLCNEAEAAENEMPSYRDAYNLTEEINYQPELIKKVLDTFNNSRATKELTDRLTPVKPESNAKKKKRLIGTE